MARRLAIVLRGPPGTGKTTILNALQRHYRLPLNSHVTLDDFWFPGEKRFADHCRYWDLRDQPDVLLIELGYGEPLGEVFAGATKNPGEWVSILEADRREVFFFLLDIDKAECLRRVAARGNLASQYTEMAWNRYAPGAVCSSAAFSSRIGSRHSEDVINTKDKDLAAAVKHILDRIETRATPPAA